MAGLTSIPMRHAAWELPQEVRRLDGIDAVRAVAVHVQYLGSDVRLLSEKNV